MPRKNARELRRLDPSPKDIRQIKRNPIYFILDSVWDTFNIGSMFRLADAVAAEKIYLAGDMETPPNSRIHKAAVGTENWVPWEKKKSARETIMELKSNGVQIVAVEQDERAVDYKQLAVSFPAALVLGHETTGLSEDVLNEADVIVELPMHGINKSFNVWGSAAVVAYKLLEFVNTKS